MKSGHGVKRIAAFLGASLAILACLGVAVVSIGQTESPNLQGKWLEFDLPDDPSITGVIVGYFASGERVPAFSFEVPRSRIEKSAGGSMRIPLVVGTLPAGQTYTIRLRTIAGARRSPWSEPSGTFVVPTEAVNPIGVPIAANDRPGRPPRSAVTALEQDPESAKRLSAKFPNVDLSEAAKGYRTLLDLAADLFAADSLKVPFGDIKKLTAGAGNRNLQQAIATLKPKANAKAEVRRARDEARRLLRDPKARSPRKGGTNADR
jgi:hypothetical protein